MQSKYPTVSSAAGALALAWLLSTGNPSIAQGPPAGESVDLSLRETYDVPGSDTRSEAIVSAAEAFIETLTEDQQKTLVFAFADDAQRANWSNLPEGIVRRGGLRLGELTSEQRAALHELLAETLSESGLRNVELQLAADDTLAAGGGRPDFGSDFYFVAFLGEPSTSQPWMLQFGGHHLAINVTFFGADASFSPMLTGGQPLHVSFEGDEVHITERELAAAQAFMDSLSERQRDSAVRGDRAINLLLGPGAFGTVVASEGIGAADLTEAQQGLLLEIVAQRLGFMNADDYAAVMARIEDEIDATYFGWWGPLDVFGGAYFRVTGPSIVMEYAPQTGFGGGDGTDHAHNIYRDPGNDYGAAWISLAR